MGLSDPVRMNVFSTNGGGKTYYSLLSSADLTHNANSKQDLICAIPVHSFRVSLSLYENEPSVDTTS